MWVVGFYKTSEQVLTNRVQLVYLAFEAIAKPPKQLNELIKEATVGAGRIVWLLHNMAPLFSLAVSCYSPCRIKPSLFQETEGIKTSPTWRTKRRESF